MAKIRRLLADLRRLLGGLRTFFRHLWARDTATVALGQFRAASPVAVRGGDNRYQLTLSSIDGERRDVTVIIDIYAAESPAHYAHFSKRLSIQPRASTPVEVRYDWAEEARFVVGGLPLAADDLWRGAADQPVSYAVHALLLDRAGERRDLLTVYQQLAA